MRRHDEGSCPWALQIAGVVLRQSHQRRWLDSKSVSVCSAELTCVLGNPAVAWVMACLCVAALEFQAAKLSSGAVAPYLINAFSSKLHVNPGQAQRYL